MRTRAPMSASNAAIIPPYCRFRARQPADRAPCLALPPSARRPG
jgi:hypothetical protein